MTVNNSEKLWCVYKHTSPSNKVYIGITCQKPSNRWNRGKGYCEQPYFYNAIQKYGWDNFKHEILFEHLTKEDAENKEVELIAYYNSANYQYGYNIGLGGSSVGRHSEETKTKISVANKGQAPTRTGIPTQKDVRERLSKSLKNRKKTEETRSKIASALTGIKRPEYTYNCKPVYCVELDLYFYSSNHASRELDIPASCISRVCRGERKTTHGYHFKFSDYYEGMSHKFGARQVYCIELDMVFDSAKSAAAYFDVSMTTIYDACRGTSITACGYHWSYYENSDEVA